MTEWNPGVMVPNVGDSAEGEKNRLKRQTIYYDG